MATAEDTINEALGELIINEDTSSSDEEPTQPDILAHLTEAEKKLLERPEKIFTDVHMFVCLYLMEFIAPPIAQIPCGELIADIIRQAHPDLTSLIAINSNFINAGEKEYLKLVPKKPVKRSRNGTERIRQGRGVAFNSGVDPIFRIDIPELPKDKVYPTRYFSTTGKLQIPGVIMKDLSDGRRVGQEFMKLLNKMFPGAEIKVIKEEPKMRNYKFELIKKSPRVLINIFNLHEYLDDKNDQSSLRQELDKLFTISGSKTPINNVSASFLAKFANGRNIRVKIFQSGKVNVLGAKEQIDIDSIYQYFTILFTERWLDFIGLKAE